jgi:uncharacterized protein involved in exopolysaccharide biosynthesis
MSEILKASPARSQIESDISLRDLAAPLFRRQRLMIRTFVVSLALLLLAALVIPPAFKSQMLVMVNRERVETPVSTGITTEMVTAGTPVTEEEINSEAELLKSRDVLEKVVVANGLAERHGFSVFDLLHPNESKEDRIARAVKSLAQSLKIKPVIKTNVIDVSYSSSNPQRSYGVLKSLGDLYVEKHVAVHRPVGSYEFFADETQRSKDAMQAAEERLNRFNKQQGIAAPDMVRTDLALQLTNSVGALHAAEQTIASDAQRMKSDVEQMSATPSRSQTQESLLPADRLLEDLKAQLLTAETKRSQLGMKYEPSYPLVQEADLEIAQAKKAIADAEATRYVTKTTDRDPTYELLREDLAKSQADLAAQHANWKATRASIASMQAEMVDLDKQALQQKDLIRDVKAAEESYLLYLSKREGARTSDALDRSGIANVAIAVPPAIPVLPLLGLPLLMAAAVGASAMLSVSLGYAVDYFDSSLRTPAQVAHLLNVPIVVSLPRKTA